MQTNHVRRGKADKSDKGLMAKYVFTNQQSKGRHTNQLGTDAPPKKTDTQQAHKRPNTTSHEGNASTTLLAWWLPMPPRPGLPQSSLCHCSTHTCAQPTSQIWKSGNLFFLAKDHWLLGPCSLWAHVPQGPQGHCGCAQCLLSFPIRPKAHLCRLDPRSSL